MSLRFAMMKGMSTPVKAPPNSSFSSTQDSSGQKTTDKGSRKKCQDTIYKVSTPMMEVNSHPPPEIGTILPPTPGAILPPTPGVKTPYPPTIGVIVPTPSKKPAKPPKVRSKQVEFVDGKCLPISPSIPIEDHDQQSFPEDSNLTYDVIPSTATCALVDSTSKDKMKYNTPEPSRLGVQTKTTGDFKMSMSTERRYSSVLAEYLQKRNTIGSDPTSINPSTILTLQADQATPNGLSYVSWPSNTSDESYERNENICFSPCPNEANLHQEPTRTSLNMYGEDPLSRDSLSARNEGDIIAIKSSELARNSCGRRSVTFIQTPVGTEEPTTYYSAASFDGNELTTEDEKSINKNTSTPMDGFLPISLNFTPKSTGSSIENCGTPNSDSYSLNMSKGTGSNKKSTSTKSFSLSPRSPIRQRGSYNVVQSPDIREGKNPGNHKVRMCGIIFVVMGVLQIACSLVIWFAVVPYYEKAGQ